MRPGSDLDLVVVVVGAEESRAGRCRRPTERTIQLVRTTWASNQAFSGVTQASSAVLTNLKAAPISTRPPTTLTAFIQSPLRGILEIRPGDRASRKNGKREHGRERRQPDDRIEEVAAGRHHQQAADDRERARERRDRQGQRHEDDADQAPLAFALRRGVQAGSSAGAARTIPSRLSPNATKSPATDRLSQGLLARV